jgi:hypothetical protein
MMTGRESRSVRELTCLSASLSTAVPTWASLGLNLGFGSEF